MAQACLVLVACCACNFTHGAVTDASFDVGSDGVCGSDPAWWNPAYAHRFHINTGDAPPQYTLRIDVSAALATTLAGTADARLVLHGGAALEVDRLITAPLIELKVPAVGTLFLYTGHAAAGAAPEDPAGVFLFSETFESFAPGDNAATRFDPLPTTEWSVIDDGGNHVYRARGAGRHPAAIRGLGLVDGEVRARLRAGTGGTQQHNGLAARGNSMVQASMDGFVGQLQGDVNRMRIAEYTNGASPPIELSGGAATVTRGTWYALRMRFVGDVIEMFVDDVPVLTATKSGSDGQLLGLYAHDTDADFDDVRVLTAMNPEPTGFLGAREDRCALVGR